MIGEKGLKIVLWICSVFYVAIPGALTWFVWTGDVLFREGLETQAKWWITGTCIMVTVVANVVAWSVYRKGKEFRRSLNGRAEKAL